MSKFLKATEIQLINGGYLSDNKGAPIMNEEFIAAQSKAEYILTFAKAAKGKNFNDRKGDSLNELRLEVHKSLQAKKASFVPTPKAPIQKINDGLAKEALSFVAFHKEEDKAEKINSFMQEFVVLKDFENHGLFFKDGIVKLNKIYTLEEVVSAVEETINLL
jgi:hypothetical protein